jgi:hypothetical protein
MLQAFQKEAQDVCVSAYPKGAPRLRPVQFLPALKVKLCVTATGRTIALLFQKYLESSFTASGEYPRRSETGPAQTCRRWVRQSP